MNDNKLHRFDIYTWSDERKYERKYKDDKKEEEKCSKSKHLIYIFNYTISNTKTRIIINVSKNRPSTLPAESKKDRNGMWILSCLHPIRCYEYLV